MIKHTVRQVWDEKHNQMKQEIVIDNHPGVSYVNTQGPKGKSPYDYCKQKNEKKSAECLKLGGRYGKVFECPFYEGCDL